MTVGLFQSVFYGKFITAHFERKFRPTNDLFALQKYTFMIHHYKNSLSSLHILCITAQAYSRYCGAQDKWELTYNHILIDSIQSLHLSIGLLFSSAWRYLAAARCVDVDLLHYSRLWTDNTRQSRFHDNSSTDISSTTLRLQTFRLQTFRLLLYTRVQDSYTSNFCFRKSLFSSIPTSTYTMIPFYQSHFHCHDTMIIQHI